MIKSVTIFSRSTPHHQFGGMEIHTWNIAREWARQGIDVELVTTAVPGKQGSFTESGVRIVPLQGSSPGRYSRSWWAASALYWRQLKTQPQVAFSVSAGAFAVVRERATHPGTSYVMQAHGTSALELRSKLASATPRALATAPRNAYALLRDLRRFRDFDRVIAVGERVYESLSRWPNRFSLPTKKVCLIRNGVSRETHQFNPQQRRQLRSLLGIADDVTVVACVGRLHTQKRPDRSLRAAAVLKERGLAHRFRFLFIGDGPEESRLRDLARQLDLDTMVHFIGRVEPSGIGGYNSAADVSLLTTGWLEVGLPLVVIEALASGLPCVVPTGYAMAPGIDSGLFGVDVDEPAPVADKLVAASSARAGRESLLPTELFLDRCAETYLEAFSELLTAARK